jgi:hypothetical protein
MSMWALTVEKKSKPTVNEYVACHSFLLKEEVRYCEAKIIDAVDGW